MAELGRGRGETLTIVTGLPINVPCRSRIVDVSEEMAVQRDTESQSEFANDDSLEGSGQNGRMS